jgi:hypothetical protein
MLRTNTFEENDQRSERHSTFAGGGLLPSRLPRMAKGRYLGSIQQRYRSSSLHFKGVPC